ncbi:MAG: hypothetical protein GTO14_11665 [Anaerolineales bacterium]|nr:hypothetical protein [Anaerolineales bacterium]
MDPRFSQDNDTNLTSATRRQIRLQIMLPLVLGMLVVVAAVVWILFSGYGSASVWADLALILLTIPMFILGLLLLAVLVVFTYIISRLIIGLPAPLRRAQRVAARSARASRRSGDLAAKPFVTLPAVWASLRRFVQGLSEIFVPLKERDYE